HQIQVVEGRDRRWTQAGLLEELPERAGGHPLAVLERARDALPQPGQDPARGATEEQHLGAGRAGPEDPAVHEIRAEGHRSATERRSWTCSRCIRSWTPANRS